MAAAAPRVRQFWIALHRYSGLAVALFLAVAGLTGSVIAFGPELDAWLNPALFRAATEGTPLPPAELIDRVEQADSRVRVIGIPLDVAPGSAAVLFVAPKPDPATGKPVALGANQLFADPVTGDILGMRQRGGCCVDRAHLIPFLRVVHYSLFAGPWGEAFMGGVALVWVVNCFVGFYLTLPRRLRFLGSWKSAWLIKRGAGTLRLNLDLHRASGLWLFAILLALAVSSVALNLDDEVFRPAVALLSDLSPSLTEQGRARLRKVPIDPILTFDDAIDRGRHENRQRGAGLAPISVFYVSAYGVYAVRLGDPAAADDAGLGPSILFLDDQDGHVVGALEPGQGTAGDLFVQLQLPLHTGRIAGLPGRIAVAVAGLVIAMLSITGVVIWWKKRRAKKPRQRPFGWRPKRSGR